MIGLGVFVILVRTSLGLPGSWQTPLIILAGIAIAVLGFLLRGEALKRGSGTSRRAASYSFVEHTPEPPPLDDRPQGITSLN